MCQTVVISHSTKHVVAVELVRRLGQPRGLREYLAKHDPESGKHLPDKIRSNVLTSDAVLILLTNASLDSRYVNQEIGVAQGARS